MANKQQLRKFIGELKKCERIEVFVDPDLSPECRSRWIHFIDRKRKFIGFTFAFPKKPLDDFVKEEMEYMTRHAMSQVGNPDIYVLRRCHVKTYKRDGAIVRKNGKWTWVK